MLEEVNAQATNEEIEVFQSRRFEKSFNKLSEDEKDIVDKEIEQLIENPELGDKKKSDLSHMRVHKFKMGVAEWLLGYSWVSNELKIYVLMIGQHENFYQVAKANRKNDLKIIK